MDPRAGPASPLVTVITAHGGHRLLRRCVESVRDQTYGNVQHLVVADGPERWDSANAVIDAVQGHKVSLLQLPYSIGKDRWCGHRIYGACTFIAEGEFVMFLDDDNYLEPGHIQACLDTLRRGNNWCFALRNIVDTEHRFICQDNCESLGKWPSVLHPEDYFVDVNCYFLPRLLAVRITPLWYRKFREAGQPEVDRVIAASLRQIAPDFDCTYRYSVNYLAGNSPNSVKPEFFLRGNEEMLRRYGGQLPWANGG
ncbi:glycosyltransferase family A protein [Variovorax sp. J22R133]|uniref:glycosyltransferase family 2 protein n=1 Tax=Variovorax brevis TaxID=3053503 RepID=UPI00257628E9|nr:glycosyltransferase family A protein [Variovorax sp. J22R133]MDM0113832.1 glycosyltransferase family A protein [Variovorax sp. J22R133]